MQIGLISDNHGYFGEEIFENLQDCVEIWHAGDIGSFESIEPFQKTATFRAVYGNIDDKDMRMTFPLVNVFECEGLKVMMTHIGGYPGRYNPKIYPILLVEKPNIFIAGHSHICKVIPDKKLQLLHLNPGAYGHHGFHIVRTILKFKIANAKVTDMNVIELGLRGRIK